jgi:AraC-like DNA-binding protein
MEKHFSTRQVAARDRQGYWVDVLRGPYGGMDSAVLDEARFSADMHLRTFGDLSVARFIYSPLTLTRRASHIRRADDEMVLFSFQLAGKREVDQDGRTAKVGAGDVAIYDSTRPYQQRFGESSETLLAQLPREQFMRRMGRSELFTAKTLSSQKPLMGAVKRFLVDLHANVDNPAPTTLQSLESCGVELLLTALSAESGEAIPQPTSRVALLYRLKSYIDAHLHDPRLTPDEVAVSCGVSPRHQRSLFAAEGDSPAAYIWAQRLRRCKRDLANPRMSERRISDIAFSWGFGDMAHFSHMFRKAESMSARDYREKHAVCVD